MITLTKFSITDYLNDHLPSHFEPASDVEYKGCCLWHSEHNPSLYINVETGHYFCHACKAKGNVVRLVQRISGFPTYSDAHEWLMERYGADRDVDNDGPFDIRFNDNIAPELILYAEESIAQRYIAQSHPYMTQERGIPIDILRMFDVGYCQQKHSVTIPWRDSHGRLLTVKHRSIDSKQFWYEPRCKELRSHLWSLYQCRGADVVYMCEAEIDAMTLWGAGKPAVALGGSHISIHQVRELVLSGVQVVVPLCDRDTAGEQANQLIRERLKYTPIDVYDAVWPDSDAKDVNELGVDGAALITYRSKNIFL